MMILKDISVINFRNYKNISLILNPNINIIYGNNAQGKTNLLESIYVLGITKSHKSFIDNNLIKNGEEISLIKGNICIDEIKTTLEVNITKKGKNLKIDNNNIKKVSEYISKMNIIIFYPEDLDLIKGSPSIRRRYINLQLSQLYNSYLEILNEYNKLLKIRNEFLKKIKKKIKIDNNYFNVITEYLINKSILIYKYRKKYIDELKIISEEIYESIGGYKNFNIKYKTSINLEDLSSKNLYNQIKDKFKVLYESEIRLGSTLCGPHRDDFEFLLDNLNLKNYGSQGQQRIAVLSLKLSEVEVFEKKKKTKPLLLLDDVFSELDDKKKNKLLKYIKNDIQTIITTTELKNIDKEIISGSKIIQIDNGLIINQEEV